MKNKTQKLILAFVFIFNIAHAANISVDGKNLKTLLTKQKLSNQEVDEAYNGLARMIDNKINLTMKDLLELCILYSQHDPSDAAYDFAYNLKKSKPKEFEKALKELSKKNRSKIEEFIKIAQSEEAGGNG